jgi:hypothetical protein
MFRTKTQKRLSFIAAGLVWAVAIGFGARKVFVYESTPGVPGVPRPKWPSASHLVRTKGKFTLVMLAHPDCPCSRASLAEIEILMAQLDRKVAVFVPIGQPGATAAEITASDLWTRAAAIPGVLAIFDADGKEAEAFGATVSGQTMLYDVEGTLVFSGGITDGRGHQGNNPGLDAVIEKVSGREGIFHAPVFGCSLRDPSAKALREDTSWQKR